MPLIFLVLVGLPVYQNSIFNLSSPPPATLFCCLSCCITEEEPPVFCFPAENTGSVLRFFLRGTLSSVCAESPHRCLWEVGFTLTVSPWQIYTHKWMWRQWRCLHVPWTAWQQGSLAEVTHCCLWISLFCTFICIASGDVCVGLMLVIVLNKRLDIRLVKTWLHTAAFIMAILFIAQL